MNKDYHGAYIVLDNFLEGAVADYENGEIENASLIEECIQALYKIGYWCEAEQYIERIKKVSDK